MAYTSVIPVHRLDRSIEYVKDKEKTTQKADSLEAAIDYAMNRTKTEQAVFEDTIGCTNENAYADMVATKKRFHKMGGVEGYHLVQSFAEGEVTPELAHLIGQELADRLLKGQYEVVITTHLNTRHYHNHIVWNSVSMADGRKYHSNAKSYYTEIRKISDELCRKYGLSIIESDQKKSIPYVQWKAEQEGRPTQRGDIRLDLDAAIEKLGSKPIDRSRRPTVRGDIRLDFDAAAMQSDTVQDLIRQMEEMGYTWNFSGKYPKIKPPGKDRYFRLYKLGAGYDSLETLAKRVLHMQEETAHKVRMPSTYYRYHGSFRKRKKATGFLALYYYHCYRIGVFAKRTYLKYTPEFREAQKQLHEMSKAAVFCMVQTFTARSSFKATVKICVRKCSCVTARSRNCSSSLL